MRWESPEFGKVSPERFFPVAEESRLIIPIGEWVRRQACAQQVAWKGEGIDLAVTANISAVQFKSPTLVERI